MPHSPADDRLKQLQKWRVRRDPDLSLSFLKEQFKREVQRPHQQLAQLITLWESLIPPALSARTRLDSLSRGVLKISVDDSATLYELDQLLRSGLQQQLITASRKSPLHRVQLRIDSQLRPLSDSFTPPR